MGKVDFPLSLLSVLKRNFWIAFLTFLSVAGGTAALSLSRSPRLYEASARLIVGEKDVGISELGQELTEIDTQSPGKAADPVATQSELVESEKVLERALVILREDNKTSSDESLNEELPKIWQLRRMLTVDVVPATNILEISYKNQNRQFAAKFLNALSQAMVEENSDSIRSQASALRSFVEDEIVQQKSKLQRAEAAESQYREQNGIVSFEVQSESLVNSLALLEDEQRSLYGQLEAATIKGGLLEQVTGVDTPASAYTTVRVGQDEDIKVLQAQITSTEIEIVEARSRLGDEHPDYLALLQKRDELLVLYDQQFSQASLGSEAVENVAANPLSQDLISSYLTDEIDRRALEGRLEIVQAELEELQSRVVQLPSYQQPLAAFARERAEAEEALKLLNGKLQEARIAEGQSLSNIRIVRPADVPSASDAISPKTPAILLVSLITGLLAGGGMAFLLELLDPTVRNSAEAEALLNLPVLEVLPQLVPTTSDLADLKHFLDDPDQVEPYRRLLRALESANESKNESANESKNASKAQVFVFSSVAAGEGKSAVALHLAAVAAMLSRRTLLVDADLREPLQHHLLEVPACPGLSERITGGLSLQDAIKPTTIDNLSVLTCGQRSSRPSALIETPAVQTLLEEAAAQYDCVIVDASPVGICADAATLTQATDGLVLVAQPRSTRREALSRAVSDLQKSGATLLGIVINQAVLPLEKEPPEDFSVEPGQMRLPPLISATGTRHSLSQELEEQPENSLPERNLKSGFIIFSIEDDVLPAQP
jgi:polysaccharide biosynthesis transport protein